MINSRHISLLTFIVLSSWLLSPISLAATGEKNRDRTAVNQTIILAQTKNESTAKQPSQVLVQDNNPTPKAGISKRLSLIGMAVTSVLSLTILVMLFKAEKSPELEAVEEMMIMPIEKSHDAHGVELIENAHDVELIEAEEIVDLLDIPIIGMEYNQEFEPEATPSQKLVEAKPVEYFDSETIVHESLEVVSEELEPMIDSDVLGKLTIVTSTTTEIDVVFELIQDLQQSSHFQEAKQNDLRRKAIWQLSQTNDFRAVEPLVKMIPQVGSLEKNLILDAITQIAHHSLETVNHVLLTSLEDDSVEVRKNAIQDLTRLYQSMSLITVHLSKMTQDSNWEIQQTAEWALKQFKQMSVPLVSIDYSRKGN
jgi:hypothetical protein